MLKKITSVITAAVLLSGGAVPCVYAADDLGTLAASLGADSGYLNIPYVTVTTNELDGKKEYKDDSFFITTMEVLVHNGKLNIGDIQADAANLSDISDSDKLRENIENLSKKLDNSSLYSYTFKKSPAKDKIPELLATAEKASANGEYFHIGYRGLSPEFEMDDAADQSIGQSGHHATGIGITDGSWTFGGKQFDKCILTLDTVNTADGKSAFSEDTCIYVNSENYDYYIPKYSPKSEDIHIIAFTSDTMLNGVTPDLFNVRCLNKNSTANYTITTHKDGVETIRNRENEYLDFVHNSYNGDFYFKADDITIECESISDGVDGIMMQSRDVYIETELSAGKSILTYDGKICSIKGEYDLEFVSPKNSENKNCLTYRAGGDSFDFYGRILDGFTFENESDGFVINPDSKIALSFAKNGSAVGNIFVTRKTKIMNDGNKLDFYIDLDNDGKFEHKVAKGDVNCDGSIDSGDASAVLAAYAALSTGKKQSLNQSLADFNGDGIINSSDASDILAKYAELSTAK